MKKLKATQGTDVNEIKYVSRVLPDRLSGKDHSEQDCDGELDHDKHINKSFWGYVKNLMYTKELVLPSFSMSDCVSYFMKTLLLVNPNKLFIIPNWIPKLSTPEVPFDLEPPTYDKVTNVIRKMKASGSPCPLDQLSIICFKRCPILRTYLTEIIQQVWSSGTIPTEWKKKHVPL